MSGPTASRGVLVHQLPRALDVAPDGALVVERDGGERHTVLAADVSLRADMSGEDVTLG